MSKRKSKQRRDRNRANQADDLERLETTASNAITIAWTVSVTMVLLSDVITIAAHFYVLRNPAAKTAIAFEAIMLLTACVLGLASLALLPMAWRASRLKPPQSYTAFAVLVAAAPIVATAVRLLR